LNTILGFTEAQITDFGMVYGLGALICFMLFIVAKLAWDCRAGKFGTFILFVGLGLGIFGFLAKYLIQDMVL
jgi:hypothetical protein